MVRFCELVLVDFKVNVVLFQFQYGAILCDLTVSGTLTVGGFQFQYGAILWYKHSSGRTFNT